MNIAYLILAHHQPAIFGRLIKALAAPNVAFFAHIDLKSSQVAFENQCIQSTVTFIENRLRVNHSGFSQLRAMLNLVEVANSFSSFDYYIFLSGVDYPIKSNSYISKFLNSHKGTNFINFYPLIDDADLIGNIHNYYFEDELKQFPFLLRIPMRVHLRLINKILPDRSFIDGMIPYRGSTSWCLTQNTVEYVLNFARSNENILSYFKRVNCPDEIFFQTIILNSEFAEKCRYYKRDILQAKSPMKNENKAYLHYIDWSKEREGPAILDLRDFERLKESSQLFARKFDECKSRELLVRIDDVFLGLSQSNHEFACT